MALGITWNLDGLEVTLVGSLSGVLMVLAGVAEMWMGVKAERQSLEDVAPPLSRI